MAAERLANRNTRRRSRDLHAKIGELTVERDFSARIPTLSRAERLEMVDRDDASSISRQCALLGISRSSVYHTPRGESAESLALMWRIDALSLEYPFYGSRQIARHLRREVSTVIPFFNEDSTYDGSGGGFQIPNT